MNRIEMTEIDQRIAKVCDPATARRYTVIYHRGAERWLVARLLPSDCQRFIEAAKDQGCEVVRQDGCTDWEVLQNLRAYHPGADIEAVQAGLIKTRI